MKGSETSTSNIPSHSRASDFNNANIQLARCCTMHASGLSASGMLRNQVASLPVVLFRNTLKAWDGYSQLNHWSILLKGFPFASHCCTDKI